MLGMSPSATIGDPPLRAHNNAYYYRRNFALFNGTRHLSLRQWQQNGQDIESSLVKITGVINVGEDYRPELPPAVKAAMEALAVARTNPYRHLLSTINE